MHRTAHPAIPNTFPTNLPIFGHKNGAFEGVFSSAGHLCFCVSARGAKTAQTAALLKALVCRMRRHFSSRDEGSSCRFQGEEGAVPVLNRGPPTGPQAVHVSPAAHLCLVDYVSSPHILWGYQSSLKCHTIA